MNGQNFGIAGLCLTPALSTPVLTDPVDTYDVRAIAYGKVPSPTPPHKGEGLNPPPDPWSETRAGGWVSPPLWGRWPTGQRGSFSICDSPAYDVVGVNPDNGGEYTGTVAIGRSGDTYSVTTRSIDLPKMLASNAMKPMSNSVTKADR
ncbi:hypothetical protein [Pararhizobium sp. O133]|uniref:hypothetical protein n=1 Tax=Pararhizobium sp. O133 TaxID=3449278 RepID=UPI003F688248